MDLKYSEYTLTPKKRANRLSSTDKKTGVFLRAEMNGQSVFADYFPHEGLGDKSVESFIQDFKFQQTEYERKVLHFLRQDLRYQTSEGRSFQNHQLFSDSTQLKSPIVKYKIMNENDLGFIPLLVKGTSLRLDANGLFDRQSFTIFYNSIPAHLRSKIDYIEDPLFDHDWSELPLKTARDFIPGSPCDVVIYKPNAQFKPETKLPMIFSMYMGSDLGNWHAHAELCESGDLTQVHGLITEEFYEEQRVLFEGTYEGSFAPVKKSVADLYQELHQREWKNLCSI